MKTTLSQIAVTTAFAIAAVTVKTEAQAFRKFLNQFSEHYEQMA